MNRTLLIVRSVMMVAFGLLFIGVSIFGVLDVQGTWQRVALAGLGALIIAFETWSWKKRIASKNNE